jgi:hypothetical protein
MDTLMLEKERKSKEGKKGKSRRKMKKGRGGGGGGGRHRKWERTQPHFAALVRKQLEKKRNGYCHSNLFTCVLVVS